MFIVKLKNGDTVEVSLGELEEFLAKNREQIKIQYKQMGKGRNVSESVKTSN